MDGFGDWGCWMLCICSKVPTNDATLKLFGDGKVYMRTAKQFELKYVFLCGFGGVSSG